MKRKSIYLLLFVLCASAFTGCQSTGVFGGGYQDSINDSSLYRSQNKTFRSN